MQSFLEIYDLVSGTSRTLLTHDSVIEAPNWDPSGQTLLINGGGKLYRVPLDTPSLIPVATGSAEKLNNDHGISPDGRHIIISNHRGKGSEIFLLPAEGGEPTLISTDSPSWWHGWSPDGKAITYVAARGDKKVVDVYTMALDGCPETRLTMGEGHCDGPDFSADGKRIYYNCDRDGHAQIWVMNTDGTGQRKLFADDHVNWFPHPSPNGKTVLYMAYPPGTTGHPANLSVALVLMDTEGQNRRRILEFTGGQGTINVPNWSPNGTAFAYVRYQPDL